MIQSLFFPAKPYIYQYPTLMFRLNAILSSPILVIVFKKYPPALMFRLNAILPSPLLVIVFKKFPPALMFRLNAIPPPFDIIFQKIKHTGRPMKLDSMVNI